MTRSYIFVLIVLSVCLLGCQQDSLNDIALPETPFERLFYVTGTIVPDLSTSSDSTPFDFVIGDPNSDTRYIASSFNGIDGDVHFIQSLIGTQDIAVIGDPNLLNSSALTGISIRINAAEGQVENFAEFKWTKEELERALQVRSYTYGPGPGQIEIAYNKNQNSGFTSTQYSSTNENSRFQILSIEDYEFITDGIEIKGKLVHVIFDTNFFHDPVNANIMFLDGVPGLKNVEGIFLFRYFD